MKLSNDRKFLFCRLLPSVTYFFPPFFKCTTHYSYYFFLHCSDKKWNAIRIAILNSPMPDHSILNEYSCKVTHKLCNEALFSCHTYPHTICYLTTSVTAEMMLNTDNCERHLMVTYSVRFNANDCPYHT